MEEPSEETALLASNISSPTISSAVVQIATLELDAFDELHSSDIIRPPELINHRTLQVAYSLVVLLSFRAKSRKDGMQSFNNPWDRWKAEKDAKTIVNSIDSSIQRVWTSFLDGYCKPQDIDNVLWTPFRVEDGGEKYLRVVDFLTHPSQASSEFLAHRLVYFSFLNYWKNGFSKDFSRSRNYLRDRYDALCTPKVLHAIELIVQILFLILLVSYTLHPPNRAVIYAETLEYIGWGEAILVFLSLALSLRKPSFFNTPFYLSFLAFLFFLPSVPSPENLSFVIVVGSISFFVSIALSSSFTSPDSGAWDRYSVVVGITARAAFFLLIRIPTFVFKKLGIAHTFMEEFERLVWRITVGPVVAIVKIIAIPFS
ncbi:hypothetical protein K435DRAFT_966690 [Dendrothele bispora CBS 962.96]|uniref:Uncharacterized protein n=1 Tax=Dendrothele bispora (strain CBS 962.96) TaxID=1314807 RepID=A0A4S8LYM1_DENBC|nr:hypothetical protein K435DRAFT_966690 [Dendrothele bispora CBS 962.96]